MDSDLRAEASCALSRPDPCPLNGASFSIVSGRELTANQPRILAEALATRAGMSLYDDLGNA